MLSLTILSLLGLLAGTAQSSEQKMMHKINKYNLLAHCFGEQHMEQFVLSLHKAAEFCEEIQSPVTTLPAPLPNGNQIEALRGLLNNPVVAALLQSQSQNNFNQAFQPFLSRNRRQSNGLLNPTPEDHEEFMEDFMDFKMDMHTRLGNLSCVMMQLKMLDAGGNINRDYFALNTLRTHLAGTPAGSDPEFVQKLANGFSDCYDISRNWPQVSLDRHPMFKKHGRHMIFFECAKKMQAKTCAQFEVFEHLERFYGPLDKLPEKLDMPLDKYDAAHVALKVLYNSASEEMKFVDDFFWQKNMMF